jgi:hypothetical protein
MVQPRFLMAQTKKQRWASLLRGFIDRVLRPKSNPLGDSCARAFALARGAGNDGPPSENRVAVIKPAGELMFLTAPRPDHSEMLVAEACRLIPREPRRTIVAIADTAISGPIEEINKTIPFIGILGGLASIGHCVIVFDGQLNRIEQGCRDADVLIVDSAVLPRLHHDWYTKARSAMRKAEIYVHDRSTFALRPILPNPRVIQ